MDTNYSSETSVQFQRTTRHYIPDDTTIRNHSCLKFQTLHYTKLQDVNFHTQTHTHRHTHTDTHTETHTQRHTHTDTHTHRHTHTLVSLLVVLGSLNIMLN
jgi:hypothetical protein